MRALSNEQQQRETDSKEEERDRELHPQRKKVSCCTMHAHKHL